MKTAAARLAAARLAAAIDACTLTTAQALALIAAREERARVIADLAAKRRAAMGED